MISRIPHRICVAVPHVGQVALRWERLTTWLLVAVRGAAALVGSLVELWHLAFDDGLDHPLLEPMGVPLGGLTRNAITILWSHNREARCSTATIRVQLPAGVYILSANTQTWPT